MTIKEKSAIDNEARRIEQIQQDVNLLRRTKKIAADTTSSAGAADKIDLSNTQEVRDALDASTVDPARRARIEELKKQVQAGTYELPSSPEQIKKMIGNMNEEVEDLQDLISE